MWRKLKDLYIWLKDIYMYSLIAFLEARVDALVTDRARLQKKIQSLETFIFELCEKDCPDEYKELIKRKVFEEGVDEV